jgi:Predicted integral membrane protein (DUF2269)
VLVVAASFADFIVAVHVLAAIVGFGGAFVFPLLLTAAGRMDPAVIPWLLRVRQRLGRYLVNPGLLVVVLAGVYLATDEHYWSSLFVGWGILAAIMIGAIEGSVVIPRAGRLAVVAERDLAAATVAGGAQRTSASWSPEYLAGFRVLSMAGIALQAIVVVTVFVMATHA